MSEDSRFGGGPSQVVAVAALGCVVALGGFHPTVVLLTAAPILLAATHILLRQERFALDPLLVALIAAGLFTFLQTVPLPAAVAGFLSPAARAIREVPIPGASTPPRWYPISIDPSSSRLEAIKWSTFALAYLVCREWGRRHGAGRLVRWAAALGTTCATIFFAHFALGLREAYGFYSPSNVVLEPMPAPLLNANHLADVFVLAAPATAALAARAQTRPGQVLLGFACLLQVAACIVAGSTGGMLALALAFGIWLWSSRPLTAPLVTKIAPGALALCAVVAFTWLSGDHQMTTQKAAVWAASLPLVGDFALVGAGRGSFVLAFAAHSPLLDEKTFTHAETLLLQWPIEWGVVVAVGMFGAVAWSVWRLFASGRPRSASVGAIAGIAALWVHNLFDFGLEGYGLGLWTFAVLGALLGAAGLHRPRHVSRWPIAVVLCGVAALVVLSVPGRSTADPVLAAGSIPARLAAETRGTEFTGLAWRLTAEHPADYFTAYLIGVSAERSGLASPLAWFNRALLLHPRATGAHLAVARHLLRQGLADQAILHYREAVRARSRLRAIVAEDLAARVPFSTSARVATTRSLRLTMWELLAQQYSIRNDFIEARKADVRLLALAPTTQSAIRRESDRLLREHRLAEGAAVVCELPSPEAASLLQCVRAREASGDLDGAIRAARAAAHMDASREAWRTLALLQARRGLRAPALRSVDEVVALAQEDRDVYDAALLRGEVLEALGDLCRATAEYYSALSIDQSSTDLLERLASLAEGCGDSSRASWAATELTLRRPADARWHALLRRIRTKQAHSLEHRLSRDAGAGP